MSNDRHETRDERRASYARMAATDFKDHFLTQDNERQWHVGVPGTGIMSFRVLTPPGAVILYGDIGELILRPHGRDSLGWLRTSPHLDYVLGKTPYLLQRKVFLIEEARAYIAEMRAETPLVAITADRLEEAMEDARLDDPPSETADALREWHRVYYEVTGDSEPPSCSDWDNEMLWCWHGLQCFLRLLEAEPMTLVA